MILTIRSWFNEPGIEFKVSYKVNKLIRQLLVEHIMQPYDLQRQDPELYIGLVIMHNATFVGGGYYMPPLECIISMGATRETLAAAEK